MSWPHFSDAELRCRCCGRLIMDPEFMEWLERVRVEFGQPMTVSSAFRCMDHDIAVAGGGYGRFRVHTRGQGLDTPCWGQHARKLHDTATARGVMGLGVMQRGPLPGRYLHLDMGHRPYPKLWSY